MQRTLTRTGMVGAFAALTVASVLGTSLVANADNIQDSIETTTQALVLAAGSGVSKTAQIKLVGNNSMQDPDDGCNIDSGEAPLVLDVITPSGITANPDPLSITSCGTDFAVSFTALSTAVGGNATVQIVSGPAGGGTYANQVSIPITVTYPNTRPTVTVQGVAAGSYEIGSEPSPTCLVVDAEDGTASFVAPISGTLTNGLGTLTATCDFTDQGGLKATTASVTYTIVDTGSPTISHVLSPVAPNTNGWFKTPVGIDFTCADAGGSGIQSCGPDTTLGDGEDQSYTGTAVDFAGNTETDVVSGINVDSVAPTINGVLSPAAPNGSNGWYTSTVGVDFQCDDALSGIASCDGDTTIMDGADGGATGTALDLAGNTAEAFVSDIDVDTVAPTIQGSLANATPASGWFNAPVTVTFTCDDATSGVASCNDDIVVGEGKDLSATGTAVDVAGLTNTSTVSGINVDGTKPTVAFVGDFGSTHYFGAVPAAPNCIAEDALSGLVTPCEVTGGGTGVGTHEFMATATDKAGNTATTKLTYEVLAWTLKGFTSPVDMGSVWNSVKGGSTVPLKFEIFTGSTELTSVTAVKKFTAAPTTCAATNFAEDTIEVTSTGGTQLRYDSTAGQYIQNWATPKSPGTCWRVTMTAQDDSYLVAYFKLK
ncbi:PxKF domain-containing protein [Agromyces sp. NPDC056523]|uniref:PxKF domain-containing protein n=1 Tax=Agromyces sp. NPDC056523 TaxID=3345850 RepID=UPI00366E813B